MKKILLATLATGVILGANDAYASNLTENLDQDLVIEEQLAEVELDEQLIVEESYDEAIDYGAEPAANTASDSDVVIYEIKSKAAFKGDPDHVILKNMGTQPINLDGWSIIDDGKKSTKAVISGVTLAPGAELKLVEEVDFKFGLGGDDSVHLFNANGEKVTSHSWSVHAEGVLRRNDAGEMVDTGAKAEENQGTQNPPTENPAVVNKGAIIINEVQSKGLNDAADYVELLNTTNQDINIKGWYLEDAEPGKKERVVLQDTIVPANGYLVLTQGTHFNFGLGKDDKASLYNANGELMDEFVWTSHQEGKVWSRQADGKFVITDPTPGAANAAASTDDEKEKEPTPIEKSEITEVVINEIESNQAGGGKDYVEIYNKSDKTIDISGWYILDNDPKHKISRVKEGTEIKPGKFFVFEEGVDFDFGLGSNDEVNLFDKDGKLVDKHAWTSHAHGTLGRYPDGTGDFVDGAPSKGKANSAERKIEINVDTIDWPGLEDITIIDDKSIFNLEDLSGLDNHDGWIYGVNNKEGRFVVFKLVDGKVEFAPGFDNEGKAVHFVYDANSTKAPGPDSEGITVDSQGRVYLAVERDNNNKNVNYNAILQVKDPFKEGKVLVADKQWDITKQLPDVGANLGIETVEWVSLANLNGLLYDQKNNKALDANDYKDAYADGVFFVGLEANGHIYALILKDDDTAEVISEIPTGLGGVMGMDYDLTNNVLWAQADDGYLNTLTVIQFNGTNNPTKVHINAPKKMNPAINNEGFVIDPAVDANGNRATYWFMDGASEKAFRKGGLKANYMEEIGLQVIKPRPISTENKQEPKPPVVNPPKEETPVYPPFITTRTREEYRPTYTPTTPVLTETKTRYVKDMGSDMIYVSKGYTTTKEGIHSRAKIQSQKAGLEKALRDIETTLGAVDLLYKVTPNIAKMNTAKLDKLVAEAKVLQAEAKAAVIELEEILRAK